MHVFLSNSPPAHIINTIHGHTVGKVTMTLATLQQHLCSNAVCIKNQWHHLRELITWAVNVIIRVLVPDVRHTLPCVIQTFADYLCYNSQSAWRLSSDVWLNRALLICKVWDKSNVCVASWPLWKNLFFILLIYFLMGNGMKNSCFEESEWGSLITG